MRSAFFGFHVASSALFTSRANLNVISHNIANAELPGFSRQVAQARASMPLNLRDGRGMYGTGSQVTGIVQMRNTFLDAKFWGQRAVLGQHTAANTHLTFVESVFNNLPDAGVLRTFNDFFARLQDLTARPEDPTFRTNVITQANSLTEMVQHHAQTLHRQQRDLNREVSDTVTTINSLGSQISSLNSQIHIFERDGSNANDLRDQRALLIDELSKLVNVQVVERDHSTPMSPNDRRMTVLINGYDFVNHSHVNRLEVVARTEAERRNEMDVPGLYDIRFAGTGTRFNIHSPSLQGTLRGLIDVRDGNNTDVTEGLIVRMRPPGFDPDRPELWTGGWPTNPSTGNPVTPAEFRLNMHDPTFWPTGTVVGEGTTTNFKGIPFYMNQLNNLVRTFARAMNEGRNTVGDPIPGTTGHIFGYNGETPPVNRGTMFFTFNGADGSPMERDDLRMWIITDASNTPLRNPDGSIVTAPVGSTLNEVTPGVFEIVDPDGNTVMLPGTATPATVLRDDMGNAVFTLDYSQMNALNFSINPDLMGNPSMLAASSSGTVGQANNDIIHGFLAIGQDRSLFREGRLSDFIIATSNHLAVDTGQAEMFQVSHEEMTLQTHNHRLSIKGVSIDEEMMNLVRFQTMFVAASRLVNVMDSVYDTLINRLGNF